jgi:hypothetical protein
VRVPADAAVGKARVRLSFREWKEEKVDPVRVEVSVVDP